MAPNNDYAFCQTIGVILAVIGAVLTSILWKVEDYWKEAPHIPYIFYGLCALFGLPGVISLLGCIWHLS